MANSLSAAFGDVLRELRHERGLSQEALSFVCDRHRTYVSLLERGKNSPSLTTIWMLAEALDVQPSKMLERIEGRMRRGRTTRR